MKDIDGYQLVDLIKTSIEMLMNMKMDENGSTQIDENGDKIYQDTSKGYDLDKDIDIDLPEGAKAGLKDASQDMRLNTSQM